MPNAVQYESAPAPTKDELGSLSNLATTNKTSAVAAINEVNSKITQLMIKKVTKNVYVTTDGAAALFTSSESANKIVLSVSVNGTLSSYPFFVPFTDWTESNRWYAKTCTFANSNWSAITDKYIDVDIYYLEIS